jgi:hypothetical protein
MQNEKKNGRRELKLKAKKKKVEYLMFTVNKSLIISLIFQTIEMSNFSITLFDKSI